MSCLVTKPHTPSQVSICDTVMYSMQAEEWAEAKAQLLYQLDKPRN
jgi:hypothetical protein